MKLSTILKWSTNLTKCFGYFPLRWNKQLVCRYGPIGDKIISLSTLAYGAIFAYLILENVSHNFKNYSLVKDAISTHSLVGLITQIFVLLAVVLVTNVELILTVSHRGQQMEFINHFLTTELELTRSISTAAANFRLLGVFIVGYGAIAAVFLHFLLQIASHTDLSFWIKLFVIFIGWPEFGMHAFKLNLLLYLMALNQRFGLLAQELDCLDGRKHELFSTLQDCVKKLNFQFGLQFGWIVLFDFMSILVVFYSFILNLVLRESDAEWLTMSARSSVCVSLLSAICWSAGQLPEKVC
jgi:hypothetical protein